MNLEILLKKNPKKFKFLNKIIHPIVRKKLVLFLSKFKKTKISCSWIFLLLIENKMFNFVDIFIFVKTKPTIFKIRIKKRKNLDKQFLKLLENQQADEKIKKSYADFTVDNSTKDKVKLQVKKILDKILLND